MWMRVKLDNIDTRNADAAFVVYKATNVINGKFYIGATRCGVVVRSKQHIANG